MVELSPTVLVMIYLGAMILTAPIAKKLGLGGILGYLIAGALLGPHVSGLLGEGQHEVRHIAEFGVIMMLFLIGLELKPAVLWKLRGPIFGVGGLQVLGTSLAFLAAGVFLGLEWQVSLTVGMILALSSTAIILQTLQEKGVLKTNGGEISLSVLLFQDIAVVPILALLPLLAAALNSSGVVDAPSVPVSIVVTKTIGAVLAVIVCGRLFIGPLFGVIARAELRELFTALSLLLVLATSALMGWVGLSSALGAFLAGVVLAESEYRHQLEADLEPFKGLLLAVFFISIGAGIDFALVKAHPLATLGLVLAIVLGKGLSIWVVARAVRISRSDSLFLAFALAQGGEFGFVLINYSFDLKLFDHTTSQLLTASVALSMAFAPLVFGSFLKWVEPQFASSVADRDADLIHEQNPVIIAGFGRFGQMVARLLRASGVHCTVLDYDVEQVEILRKFGMKAFFGDASRMDLLAAAGAKSAKLLLILIDDKEKTTQIATQASKEFPNLKIMARAYDRIHAYELIHLGITNVAIETSGSAVNLGTEALMALGFRGRQAMRMAATFKKVNEKSIFKLARMYHEEDEATYINSAKNWLNALEETMKVDFAKEVMGNTDRGWESATRKDSI